MAQQGGFLHIQQHRRAAGDFILPCKDRRREKKISSLSGSFACYCASPMEKVIECRLGWQNVSSCSVTLLQLSSKDLLILFLSVASWGT